MVTNLNLGACEKFVVDLRKSGLIERGQLDQVVGEFLKDQPRAEPPAMAEFLVSQGYLTPFQADRIQRGKGGDMILGPYVLTDSLGSGSLGTVFKAQSKSDKEWYAVKVLPRRSMWNVLVAKRIVRNYETIRNDAIVPFVDVGTAGGTHYLVWPYVQGETLETLVTRDGRFAPAPSARLVAQIADGLGTAHQRNLFHGSVKPSNIMVDPEGQGHILDFGLGSLLVASEGESLIDTQSMANAQASGLDCVSPESILDPTNLTPDGDQYSLGCVLYFCLTGQYPFPGDSAVEKMQAHQLKQPTPVRSLAPEVPEAMAAVVAKMMQKKPGERFSSMAEVVQELSKLARTAPTTLAGSAAPAAAAARSLPSRHSIRVDGPASPPVAAKPTSTPAVAAAKPPSAPAVARPPSRPAVQPAVQPAKAAKPTDAVSQDAVNRAMGNNKTSGSKPSMPAGDFATPAGPPPRAASARPPSEPIRNSSSGSHPPGSLKPPSLPSRAMRRPFEMTALLPLYKTALRLSVKLSLLEQVKMAFGKRATPRVDCTVLSPPILPQGVSAAVHVLVFQRDQLELARRLAEFAGQNTHFVDAGTLRLDMSSSAPVAFRLSIPELQVDDTHSFTWLGTPDLVSFPVKVPTNAVVGETRGHVTVERDGMVLGTIEFAVKVSMGNEKSPVPEPIPVGMPK
jgi:serine/threonine-protein kinase